MKILVYDDNPDFGGHQIMAVHGVEALAANPALELIFMANPANDRLAARLRAADIPTISTKSGWPSPHPDRVVCIQGDIAQSTKGLLAARKAGSECFSYLSLPHTMAEMGAKHGAFRDRINQRCINLPDRIITISEGMKQKLVTRGCIKPVTVVPNGIPVPPASRNPRDISHSSPCILGLAGRIEFKQKQQDFVAHAFQDLPQAFQDCKLLIAGDGPDEKALHDISMGHDNISFLAWTQDMDSFYDQIDLLVIPSRYEGVPLTMLEALARGIPVIGSNRDGMRDLLPRDWTFEAGNAAALAETFAHVRDTWQNDMGPLRERVLTEHSLEAFKSNFSNAVLGMC